MFGLATARADDYPPNTLPRQSVAKIAETENQTWTFDTIDEATYTATLAADQKSLTLDLSGWTGKSVLDTLGDTAVLSFKRYKIETPTTDSLPQVWQWNGTTDYQTVWFPRVTVADELDITLDITVADFKAAGYTVTHTGLNVGARYRYQLVCALGEMGMTATVPLKDSRGKIILVVDNTMQTPLAAEIAQLQSDLRGDGWTVITEYVPRMAVDPATTGTAVGPARLAEIQNVRGIIRGHYNADPANVKQVYLLGRVAQPYMGGSAEDGHTDHNGAWPSDTYYAEMDDTVTVTSSSGPANLTGQAFPIWTDSLLDKSTARDLRNYNIPGDGKLDRWNPSGTTPQPFPSYKLGVGRVDLSGMDALVEPEVELTRRYLRNAHQYRHRSGPYATIRQEMFWDNGWGGGTLYNDGSLMWGAAEVGGSRQYNGEWLDDLNTVANPYLLAHGGGAGGPTSVGGAVTTGSFASTPVKAIFSALFGSYFGDWGNDNNVMRASLAPTPETTILSCIWNGGDSFPKFDMRHTALGETLGYGHWRTLGEFMGLKERVLNLLGDPALRTQVIPPVSNVRVTPGSGQVTLAWDASAAPDLQGYHVYRATSPEGPFVRVTGTTATPLNPSGSPLAATTFTNTGLTNGTAYTYMVKAVALTTTHMGRYANASIGVPVTVTPAAGSVPPSSPAGLSASILATNQIALSWTDTSADETGFVIEKKAGYDGAWTSAGSVGAGVTSLTDNGPLADGQAIYYRVKAVNGGLSSLWSPEVAAYGESGHVMFGAEYQMLPVSGTSVAIGIERRYGALGAVSVTFSTSNSPSASARAGTHYQATTATVSWADGETGVKYVNVPLLSAPQLTRGFDVALSNPTGGAIVGKIAVASIAYEDRSTALPLRWTWSPTDGLFDGAYDVPYLGYATQAEGAMGMAMTRATASSLYDAGAYIVRQLTGDGVLTGRVKERAASGDSRAGLVVRENLEGVNLMFFNGLKRNNQRVSRHKDDSTDAEVLGSGTTTAPYWFRITRSGQTFTAETSPDGANWTVFNTRALVGMDPTLLWGLQDNSGYSEGFALSAYDNVSLSRADRPSGLAATVSGSNQVTLTWNDNCASETGYRIEMRAQGGTSWVRLGDAPADATSYVANGIDTGTTPDFRVTPLFGGLAVHDNTDAAYVEPFFMDKGSSPASQGWQMHYKNGSAVTDVSTNDVNSTSGAANNSDNHPGVHSGQDIYLAGIYKSVSKFPNGGTGKSVLFLTDEYPIPAASYPREKLILSIDQRDSNSAASPFRFALKIGGGWYASGTTYSIPGSGSSDWTRQILDFASYAGGWKTLNFVPGSTLALGSDTTLPAGDIQAFGIYFDPNYGHSGLSVDTFRVGLWNPESTASNVAALGAALPGTLQFASSSALAYKAAGTATLQVQRINGDAGAVTVAYATANGTAVSGTDYTATSGTLSWAGGDLAPKTIVVPIAATGSSATMKYFQVSLSAPGGGAFLGAPAAARVFLADGAAQAFPAGWASAAVGAFAETPPETVYLSGGRFVSQMAGGNLGTTGADALNFIYRTQSGNGMMTAYIPAPVPPQASGGAKLGLMIRENTSDPSGRMVAVAVAGDASGARMFSRATAGTNASETGATTGFTAPCWLRLIRDGDLFIGQASTNGTSWTTAARITVAGVPSNAVWGLFHVSSSGAGAQAVAFPENQFSLGALPVPGITGPLQVVAGGALQANLAWDVPENIGAEFRVERRLEGGSFAQIGTTTSLNYSDTTLAADKVYEYRVRAANGAGFSAYITGPQRITAKAAYTMSGTVTAAADAHVDQANPNANYGSATSIPMVGAAYSAYLRFDLSGFPQGTVTKATFEWTLAASFSGAMQGETALLTTAANVWDEATITYNNRPSANGAVGFSSPFLEQNKAAGFVLKHDAFAPSALASRIGGPVTFQVDGYDKAINVASRENGTYAGPKLVLNLSVDYPDRPSALAGTVPIAGRVSLTWQDNSSNETGFVVEVSTDNGATWNPWATVAANATAALFDAPGGSGNQRYRVYATRVIPNAPPLNSSPTLSVTLDPGSVVPTYGGWTSSYGLPSDGTGLGAPMASPVGDGIPNTLKYALGIDPWQSGYQGHLAHGTVEVSGTTYLSLTYTRPEPPPSDVTYTVEVSGDLVTWNAAQTAQVSSTDNGDRTRTIVVRDTQPMPSAGRRFIRLKVTGSFGPANSAPTDLLLSNSSVYENKPVGTAVGVFSTVDPDGVGPFLYSLVPGTGGDDNGLFAVSGSTLQTNAVFDYETKSSYTVRARTLDPGGLAFDKVFAISIAENPPAGETLLQDPFDDGGVTDGADPLDAAWYRATGTGLVDASVAARPDNGSNALFHKQTGNAGSAETVQLSYGASFPARTLAAVGDTVALSLTLRTADVYNNVTTIGNFGMGLWDGPALAANYGQGTGVAGYYHTASNLTVPASKFWKETGAVSSWPMHGTDTAQIGATGGFGIADNTTYTYTFTVTKTAAGVDITFSDGTNTQTVSDTSGAYTTFSRVHVGIGRRDLAENDVYLDDITVTFTPAP